MQLILLLALPVAVFGACTIRNGNGVIARIKVKGSSLDIDLINSKAKTNEWTAIAFGPDMSDLEVYVFEVTGDQVKAQSGFTEGYESPQLDGVGSIRTTDSSFDNGSLHVRFTRPSSSFGPRSHSLDSCVVVSLGVGAIEDGAVGFHYERPHQKRICFSDCH